MKISVIIPTLAEAERLPQAIAAVRAMTGEYEIIVVDCGGDSMVNVEPDGAIRSLRATRGRASQMNCGAAEARGDVLLFLHADTRLPVTAHEAITGALADPEVAGGCFRIQFDHGHPVLRFSVLFTRFHFPFFHYGDSAYFVRREVFEKLGGYKLWPLMEDIDFWRRLNRDFKTIIVKETVVTSARRFLENGVTRQQTLAVFLVVLYACGVAPAFLARLYNRRKPATPVASDKPGNGFIPAIATGEQDYTTHFFKAPSLWQILTYLIVTVWRWAFSNVHMIKQTLNVLDFMWWHKVEAGLLPEDHPWLTGIIPGSNEPVWPRNIVFATPRKNIWSGHEPEADAIIITRVGAFLAAMVARSNIVEPEIPHGKQRRMPHAVNYIHGSVHCNGGYVLFNDFEDAMYHLSDSKFARQFITFSRREKRELTIVLRERIYDPEEYAWFLAFVRSHLRWYANANGPTKKRVLHGTPSPYPVVNPINGSWIRDVRNLQRGRLDRLVMEPLRGGKYFTGAYQGNQADYSFLERFHAWAQYLVTRTKGFQGGLVFTDRRKIEPEHWQTYEATNGKWEAGYPISHPFRRMKNSRAEQQHERQKPDGAVIGAEGSSSFIEKAPSEVLLDGALADK